MSVTLRKGTEKDLRHILELIKELALFEKEPEQVVNTVDQMKKDGFGPNPVYWFFVAENEGKIIGTAIYYLRYSTWKGVRLYLEDLIITEKSRGIGAGKMLFEACINEAKSKGYSGMVWQVLDWNTPAIDFYKSYHADLDGEWVNGSLEF
ncbi:MAG: GNAT family N-acetyltransferase [Cyclobacteriaceae bacterium]|nr:GNAT family N-acetyltransferase [Cyclobacteriaceae bacterium]